ncbi:MAG: hypothetical protein CM1200mP38_3180 [Dehalococcoidia bacterium]|nr:MAG: hypothetical protein CM1200mP38_3180 [Dehalococcoidia bacterium]
MGIFTCELNTNCFEQTQTLGRFLGSNANSGDVFLLSGDLGAGKLVLLKEFYGDWVQMSMSEVPPLY